jgi:DNA-binding transcriptional ArsR family regulator
MSALDTFSGPRGRRADALGRSRSTAAAERIAAELPADVADEVSRRLRVLGDPTRVALVVELAAGPRSVADLAATCGLDPAAASKHLRELQRASMVCRRQDGTHAIYALVDTTVLKVLLMVARAVHADAAPVTAALRVAS